MIDKNKNELSMKELNMDELEMVTGGTENEGESIGVHNYFNDYINNGSGGEGEGESEGQTGRNGGVHGGGRIHVW